MKIETLKTGKITFYKRLFLGVTVVCSVLGVFTLGRSHAKYRVTEGTSIAKGNINWTSPDMNILAMYQKNSGGTYDAISTMPTSGYKINESSSYCYINTSTQHDTNAVLKTVNGVHVIENLSKGDKCYIYFDPITATNAQEIIAGHKIVFREKFNAPLTSDTTGTLYQTYDDDGVTYFYSGKVSDNWVHFAGAYWRIIRINGDGTIRMIYSGTTQPTEAQKYVMTGTGTQVTLNIDGTDKNTFYYATSTGAYNDNAYVGYMRGSTIPSTSYAEAHANEVDSYAKTIVDKWYENTIKDTAAAAKIDTNAGFCVDRSVNPTPNVWETWDTGKGFGTQPTAYGPRSRTYISGWFAVQMPSLHCADRSNDLFTPTTATSGNKKLQYPVGLITSDEVIFAGGKGGSNNTAYYLYTNQNYWTLSPDGMHANGHAAVFSVRSDGLLAGDNVDNSFGVRPVINLKADTTFTGSGTWNSPYEV